MREIRDESGHAWEAIAVQARVAHGRGGATLAFRPAGEPDAEVLLSSVSFNSPEAAELAISTMGEKELRRRLDITRQRAPR